MTHLAPAPGPPGTARRRRWLWPAVVVLLVLFAALVVALAVPATKGGDLDPESATPQGSRALAQILRRQGVDVRVVRTSTAVTSGPGTTLVVVQPDLAPYALLELLGRQGGGDLVVVEPDAVTLDALAVPVTPVGEAAPRVAQPACADAAAVAAGATEAGGTLYRSAPAVAAISVQCYPDDADRSTASLAFATVQRSTGPQRVTVIGQSDILRNENLTAQGNAALALRLLGHQRVLQWYVPNPLELTGADSPTLGSLVPPWVWWTGVQLAVAAVVAMLWRGRRLGKLVSEPLPVVVRAAETQEGRARLYRQAGGRDRAAATLRTAAVRRLARRFDVAADASPTVVADLAAQACQRDPVAVRAVLLGPAPRDDAALVHLADEIDVIETGATS